MYLVDASLIFFSGVFSNSVQNNDFVHHILCGGSMYPVEQKSPDLPCCWAAVLVVHML